MSSQFKNYVELMRLEKPAGFLLLMWPCWWGVFLSAGSINNLFNPKILVFLFLFLIGAIIVRGAGCIVNDIADRKIDAQVERTKNRPLASGVLQVWQAILFLILLLSGGLYIFLELNLKAEIAAILAFFVAVIYPFTKRFFVMPQLVLGICFNSGVLIATEHFTNQISSSAIYIYIAGICWTLAYDTIYANQDKPDDIKAGINSSALFFGSKNKMITGVFFALTLVFFIIALPLKPLVILALTILALDFLWQMQQLDVNNAQKCLSLFKHNAFISGGLALICILASVI